MNRANRKAQQKMQSALETANNIKISDGGSCSLTKKALEQNNCKALSKDNEVSAIIFGNCDERYIILTFVPLEPDAHWKFIVPLTPVQDPDQQNDSDSLANVNLDRLLLVFPPSAISLQVDPQKARKNHRLDRACSAKSLTNRILGSNIPGQSRNRGMVNRRSKLLKDSGNTFQKNSSISSNCSTSTHDKLEDTWLDDLVKDKPLEEKPIKRSSRKNSKKKGKPEDTWLDNLVKDKPLAENPIKRSSRKKSKTKGKRRTTSSSLEAVCEEDIRETSLSETCTNDSMVWEEGSNSNKKLAENEMRLEVSLQDNVVIDDGEGNKNGDANYFSTRMMVSSYSDRVKASEAIVCSLPQNLAISSANETAWVPSNMEREVVDVCSKQANFTDIPTDEHSGPILDSVFGGLNSDFNTDAADDFGEQPTVKEDDVHNIAERYEHSSCCSRLHEPEKECSLHENSSKCGIDVDNCAEKTKCSSTECSSSELPLFEPVKKRGRRGRKHSGTSSCAQKFSLGEGYAYGNTGKENNSSVWQKVRSNNVDGCNFELDVGSGYDIASKDVDALLKLKGDNKSKNTSEKVKKKSWVEPKQENTNPKKESHASVTNSKIFTKMTMQEEEPLEVKSQVDHCNGSLTGSTSHCYVDCSRVGPSRTIRIDSTPLESVKDSSDCPEMDPVGGASTKVCYMIDQPAPAQKQSNLSAVTSELLDQTHLLEGGSYRDHEDLHVTNAPVKLEAEVYEKQDHDSGSVPQKWMSVVRKDAFLADSSGSDSLLMPDLDESVSDGWSLKGVEKENLNSSSSTNVLEASSCSTSVDANNLRTDDANLVAELRNNDTCVSKDSNTLAVSNCILKPESKDHAVLAFETDSNKVALAAKNAYRIELACEDFQLATGRPLAEFEKFLHSASPILSQTHTLLPCQSCSRGQFFGASMCRHEIRNISLRSIWQWYESHGNYGLEVRAEDCRNFKRVGVRNFEFCAYFLPFLSAVQLFGSSRRHSHNTSNGILNAAVSGANDMTDASENSSSPALSETCFDDSELLFEYLELEPPRNRPPLFQKIKQLIRGEAPSRGQAYGDPTKLDSLDLHELHPASWYSVAWYPIYRIPDGKFRAAFVTYHSLGHLIRKSTPSDCFGGDTCVVSPVVGLQSYNFEGECWFQLRHNAMTHMEKNPTFNSCQILKDRLRTLGQTASVMATNIINKESLRFVSGQSDYEFFLSRQRW